MEEKNGEYMMSHRKKAEIVFKEELEQIKSSSIRSFTLKCFEDLTPDYFWDYAASSSGKYHPEISNKKHGLVLHTKLSVWWGIEMSSCFDCNDLDIIISALLLHDLQKFGMSLDKYDKPTLANATTTHGPFLAAQLEKIYENVNMNENIEKEINSIITCIALHMGKWTNPSLSLTWETITTEEDKLMVDIVHLSDFIASRKVDEELKTLNNYRFTEK
jgi:hypothetical protein